MTIKDKDGRWIDSAGCAIPPKYVKPMDKKRDAMVEKLIRRAQKISGQLAAFRALVLEDVEKYLKYIEEHYQVNGRTREGNKQLTNFSNNIKLELRVAKNIEFDEKLALAKTIIDECIRRWSDGANDKIMLLIDEAFKVDKKGNIDRDRVLSLRKLKIRDREWKKAMDIIAESMVIVGSRTYVKFSVKNSAGAWVSVPLDIAACG